MSWVNPPPSVVAFRDALINCATVQTVLTGMTLLQQQARFHYPKADFRTDAMPGFVLSRPKRRAERSDAFGTTARGTTSARYYTSDSSGDEGTVETQADAICDDLCSLSTADTLYIIGAESGECVDASPGMGAAAVNGQPDDASVTFRVTSIDAEWEG